MEITPIAYFKSPFGSKFGIPRQSGLVDGLHGEIHFTKEYRRSEAVRGMEEFDFIWLIWGFSANRPTSSDWQPTVRPPRLGGNASMGVFATRSPFRPNPLGLSSVRIDHIDMDGPDAPVIHVIGADLMDGTPVYDIKPYITYADSHPDAASGFVDSSEWTALEVVIPDEVMTEMKKSLNANDIEALESILSLDPRPHYQKDPEKEYGMPYSGMDIHFTVKDRTLTVCGISELKEGRK